MEAIMNYDEIMEYINNGYKPLQDLQLSLKYNYLNNNGNYRVWINEKHIDVYGGNLIERYIPTHIAFGKVVRGHHVCYPTDRNYVVNR